MSINRNVAAKIKEARGMRGYSQNYLAFKLKISQNAYSKLELGVTTITVERLFQIADLLDVSVIDLIDQQKIAKPMVNADLHLLPITPAD